MFPKFYVHENRKHRHVLRYECLLERAKKLRIHGGTAFRAAAFGHHGTLHFQHFFELAGDLMMQLDFLVSAGEARRLFDAMRNEKNPSAVYEDTGPVRRAQPRSFGRAGTRGRVRRLVDEAETRSS